MDEKGLIIGIIGGVGLGLLLGSEFSGRYATVAGAVFIVASLFSMGVLLYKSRKK